LCTMRRSYIYIIQFTDENRLKIFINHHSICLTTTTILMILLISFFHTKITIDFHFKDFIGYTISFCPSCWTTSSRTWYTIDMITKIIFCCFFRDIMRTWILRMNTFIYIYIYIYLITGRILIRYNYKKKQKNN
jgi:hypothetical protein